MIAYRRRLRLLTALVWLQKATRLTLRATWLAAGLYLAARMLHTLTGLLPDTRLWLVLALAPVIIALVLLFIPLPRTARLAWRIDRHYGFHEQLSAAWEVSDRGQDGVLTQQLVEEAHARLPRVMRRILWRGWNITADAVSLMTVIVLYALILGSQWIAEPTVIPETELAHLPPLVREPSASDLFPSDIPGLDVTVTTATGSETMSGGQRSAATEQALRNLGAALSQQAASHNVGQALENGDLQSAAREMEFLADNVDQLSAETREALAGALQQAGEEIAAEGTPEEASLGQEMQSLADQLRGQDERTMRDQMDRVAAALRDLPSEPAALAETGGLAPGEEAGQEAGDVQPFQRLEGQGETLSLGAEGQSGSILRPGPPPEGETQVASGALDRTTTDTGAAISAGNLTPYQIPWGLRDVVSQYFSPR